MLGEPFPLNGKRRGKNNNKRRKPGSLHDSTGYPASPAVRLGSLYLGGDVTSQRLKIEQDACGLDPQALFNTDFIGPVTSPLETQILSKAKLDTRPSVPNILFGQRQGCECWTCAVGG